MSNTGAAADGDMPTPDMTTDQPAPEPTLSPRERQKLEVFREEHPQEDVDVESAPEENMPNPSMTEDS
jgi:hypothetical protein